MKILFLTNCPSPYRVAFFNELAKKYDLTVLYEIDQAKNRSEKWKSEEQYDFHAVYLNSLYRKTEGAFCPEIIKYIKQFRDEIIIVGGYSTPTGMCAILYMKQHHIPFVLNCDGGMVKNDPWLKRHIKTFFIGSASYWLSTGKVCTDYLIHYGAKKERIYPYTFTSVRLNEIGGASEECKMDIRAKLGIHENKVVLFVGSFIYRKGLDILLAAVKDLVDTAIVLVGGDDISAFGPDDGKDYKCHIYIEGFKTKTELKLYYQAADVFVLPTREDVWGLVVNEAMAAGLPVVTTDQCGAGLELIQNGENGYVVPIGKTEELAQKISMVLNDKVLMEHMKIQNLRKMEHYTIEEMAAQHECIVERIWKTKDRV